MTTSGLRRAPSEPSLDLWSGIERVVIVAEPDSAAARLYERAGFRTIEYSVSACRYPPDISRPIRRSEEAREPDTSH
jgi:hypothetical protein